MGLREHLKVISEADGRYDELASPAVKAAVAIAEKSAGVVPVDPAWEQSATPEQRIERRELTLAREKEKDPEIDKHLGQFRAKYKIEVGYDMGRTTLGPNVVGVQVYESGKRLNGGGDDRAFWCRTEDGEGCGGVIFSNVIKRGVGFCTSCKKAVNANLLTEIKIGKFSTRNLATELEKLFRLLGSNADIYLKFHKTDPRYLAMEKAKGPEVAHRLRGLHIYSLQNILKDTANGASLHTRIFAFLTS